MFKLNVLIFLNLIQMAIKIIFKILFSLNYYFILFYLYFINGVKILFKE